MEEMERIKPGINAEAASFRLSLPEAPTSRPPPLQRSAGPTDGSGAATAAAGGTATGTAVAPVRPNS